jgi:hypothetical protein
VALRCGVNRIDLTYSSLWEKVLGKFARSSWSIVQSHEIEKLSSLYKHSKLSIA